MKNVTTTAAVETRTLGRRTANSCTPNVFIAAALPRFATQILLEENPRAFAFDDGGSTSATGPFVLVVCFASGCCSGLGRMPGRRFAGTIGPEQRVYLARFERQVERVILLADRPIRDAHAHQFFAVALRSE